MIEDLWERVLISAMKLPGIAVNRREFLSRELAPYVDRKVINEILDGHTKMKNVLPRKDVQKLAEGCISYHLTKASLISAVAGIPGGFAMLATIPADMFWLWRKNSSTCTVGPICETEEKVWMTGRDKF